MENVDWQSVTAGGLAVAILLGGLLMMFSNVWTTSKKRDK